MVIFRYIGEDAIERVKLTSFTLYLKETRSSRQRLKFENYVRSLRGVFEVEEHETHKERGTKYTVRSSLDRKALGLLLEDCPEPRVLVEETSENQIVLSVDKADK